MKIKIYHHKEILAPAFDWTILEGRRLIYKKCGEELSLALAIHHGEMLNKANVESEKRTKILSKDLR